MLKKENLHKNKTTKIFITYLGVFYKMLQVFSIRNICFRAEKLLEIGNYLYRRISMNRSKISVADSEWCRLICTNFRLFGFIAVLIRRQN